MVLLWIFSPALLFFFRYSNHSPAFFSPNMGDFLLAGEIPDSLVYFLPYCLCDFSNMEKRVKGRKER